MSRSELEPPFPGQQQIARLREELTTMVRLLARHHAGPAASLAVSLAPQLQTLQQILNRLEQDLTAQADERAQMAALAEVARAINSSLDLSEVLNRVMDEIIRLTGAERAFLMLIDPETGELEFRTARNMDQETIADSAFEISRSVVYRVAQEGEPVVTTDAQLDPRFKGKESIVSYSLRSILCVPLRARDRVTGVIYADNRIRTGIFGDRDRDLLAAFADQAAIAIENARLFESVTAAKALMDNIFASIASGVVTTDEEDRITLVNRAAEGILGIAAGQAEGRPYTEAFPTLRPFLEPLMERVQREDRTIVAEEVEPELPGRGRVNLSLSLSPLRDPEHERSGVALVLEDLTERRRLEAQERFIRETFQRYVCPAVVQRLLEDPGSLKLGGHRQEVTILFADIRGFTAFSEHRDPEDLVEVLNCYLSLGADAVLAEEGTLDKFIGDAVMAIFNAPLPQPDHTLRAVRAALRMQEAVRQYHGEVPSANRLAYGVGVAVGEAVVGNIGTAQQLNYTAIGASVNLAKRLQENAAAGQILLNQEACERVRGEVEVRPLSPMEMKGLSAPIQVYELLGLRNQASS
ncbi:MAG TPA: adenylate/guanylate cyclase domain-containing protein [Anaerolineales bacterium]|nr:adenylate/guanylate cyclase domain-containing protein [Anaerolineae bacterium]HIQ02406.1 adenylate/guanylate cyclase domain-containing protein [Anaerolineales bacterium]